MKSWVSTLALMGAGVISGAEKLPVASKPGSPAPEHQKSNLPLYLKVIEGRQSKEPDDVDIMEWKTKQPELSHKKQADAFELLNSRQQEAVFESLPSEVKKILAHREIDDWTHINNHVRPSPMTLLEANSEYMSAMSTFAFEPIDVVPIGLKSFKDKLAPSIHKFTVRSIRGNAYASGLMMEADVDPALTVMNLPEEKGPRYARAELAVDQPGGKVRATCDTKTITLTFPEAGQYENGKNIELTAADMDKVYELVTHDEFKAETSSVPWIEDMVFKKEQLKLPCENGGGITLNTAPGVEIDLTDFKADKNSSTELRGVANSTYRIGKDTRHIHINISSLPRSIKPYQKQAILEIPLETAEALSVKYVTQKAGERLYGLETVKVDGTNHIELSDKERGVRFTIGADFFIPDPELVKAGIKMDGMNGALRIRDGKRYIDIPLMRDTQFVAESAKQLEAQIASAAAILKEREHKISR